MPGGTVRKVPNTHGHKVSGHVSVEQSSALGGMIETYCCQTCGQVQARCCVGHARTWVRDYDNLWRTHLAELWMDPELSVRAISRVLKVSCDTTRKHALKLGLPLIRAGHRPLSVRSYSHLLVPKAQKRVQKVESLRKRWLGAKRKHPELAARGLRQKLPAVYATLFRYDRNWLKVHQPPRKPRELSVNWNERDEAPCRKLEMAACRLQPVTPGRLARAAGMNGWISDRLSRLPRARKTLLRLTRGRQTYRSKTVEF
jgi:hypothetical protein